MVVRLVEEPLPAEKDALIRLVKNVVIAQGNVFIKATAAIARHQDRHCEGRV
jgi:hypothetical protein